MMCKKCRSKEGLTPHCGGLTCDWVVCGECKSVSDAVTNDPQAYFEKSS